MGKKWFKKKTKKEASDQRRKQNGREGAGYDDLARENKNFEEYYKAQNIVSAEEWDVFLQCLKEDLPVAFRFTGFKSHVETLSKLMQQKYFQSFEEDVNKPLKITCLPWYPDNLGWQLNATRKDIRRTEPFWNLHQFLISETETGNISRQEAVSMIPPLLLDVKPSHKVLDMCAAPGSKTAQIIEFLHYGSGTPVPEGVVIANDADNKRCYMLTHQVKRLQSPTLMITNHDAAMMPNIQHTRKDGTLQTMKFDRILCDVPCSGDGTLRKNFDVWSKWNAVNGANLHGLQFRIARRGLEMLDVGGRLVYSTCSLNPVENEAVINRLMLEFDTCIELLDVKENLPGLKIVDGLEEWSVMNKDLTIIESVEKIPPQSSNYIHKHLFPPSVEDRNKRYLKRCIRILPHHQNTGGFFVAVLVKLKPLPGEKIIEDAEKNQTVSSSLDIRSQRISVPPRKRRCRGYKEEPFFYLEKSSEEWKILHNFYGILNTLDASLFLSRAKNKGKNLYFTNALVKDIVINNENRIKIINTGVKVFVRCENKGSTCNFRLTQEGTSVLLPFMTERKLYVKKEDMVLMLLNEDSEMPPQIESLQQETQDQCQNLECGSILYIYEDKEVTESIPLKIHLVGWKGKHSVRSYIAKNERVHFLRLLGADTSAYEKNKFLTNPEVIDIENKP